MKEKRKGKVSYGQVIFFIICLLYTVGVIVGFLFADKFNLYSLAKFTDIKGNEFYSSFFYFAKFSFPIWISGIFSAGIFFIIPWCILCGCFYGVSANAVVVSQSATVFLLNTLQFFLFTASVFVFTSYAINLSLGKYKQYKSPKARLPREKNRIVAEYIIILCLGLILTALAAALKIILN